MMVMLASLRKCKPAVYENKIRIIGREVTVRQEIKGIEDGFCRLIIGSDSERKSDCRIPLEKMKVLADSFQNPEPADNDLLNDDKYCQDLPTDKVNSFNDVNGVAYDCDTVLNVQLVSVEECSKCPNRKMVENSKLKFNGKPLNYCVLKQCPAGVPPRWKRWLASRIRLPPKKKCKCSNTLLITAAKS